MGILFAIGSSYYINSQKQIRFENTVREALQIIKEARNLAISSSTIPDPDDASQKKVPPGGFGINLSTATDPHQIILFSDRWNQSESKNVDLENQNPSDQVQPDRIFTPNTSDLILKKFNFANDVEVENIEVIKADESTAELDQVNILFSAPFAETIISDQNGNTDLIEVRMTIKKSDPGQTALFRIISLNKISGFPYKEVILE